MHEETHDTDAVFKTMEKDARFVSGYLVALAHRVFLGHAAHAVVDAAHPQVQLRVSARLESTEPDDAGVNLVRIGRFTCSILEPLMADVAVSVALDRAAGDVVWTIDAGPSRLARVMTSHPK